MIIRALPQCLGAVLRNCVLTCTLLVVFFFVICYPACMNVSPMPLSSEPQTKNDQGKNYSLWKHPCGKIVGQSDESGLGRLWFKPMLNHEDQWISHLFSAQRRTLSACVAAEVPVSAQVTTCCLWISVESKSLAKQKPMHAHTPRFEKWEIQFLQPNPISCPCHLNQCTVLYAFDLAPENCEDPAVLCGLQKTFWRQPGHNSSCLGRIHIGPSLTQCRSGGLALSHVHGQKICR